MVMVVEREGGIGMQMQMLSFGEVALYASKILTRSRSRRDLKEVAVAAAMPGQGARAVPQGGPYNFAVTSNRPITSQSKT